MTLTKCHTSNISHVGIPTKKQHKIATNE